MRVGTGELVIAWTACGGQLLKTIDEAQDLFGRSLYSVDGLLLAGIQVTVDPIGEELLVAEDGGERCAQLVSKHDHEFAQVHAARPVGRSTLRNTRASSMN